MAQASTRKQALQLGLKTYYTGKPCKRGHIDIRYTASLSCRSCGLLSQRKENISLERKIKKEYSNKKWREKNPDKVRELSKKWREKNPDKVSSSRKKLNQDSVKESRRKWAKAHSDIITHHVTLRNARKSQAIPKWANKDKIKEFYCEARNLTKETGVKHVVDHIVPLTSDVVCGLHVETNLRVISENENLKKYNHHKM